MLFIKLLLVAFVVAVNAQSDPECGKRPLGRLSKIVNGVEAIPGDWPWQVSLTNNGQHFCGGTLINKQWVLSASHCFMRRPQNVVVDLGVHDRRQKESYSVSVRAVKIIMHEYFNRGSNLGNDVALIKLAQPLSGYSQYISPACLPSGSPSYFGKKAWVTGWGDLTYQGQNAPDRLRQYELPILSDSRCQQKYSNAVVAQQVLCGGDYNINGGACQGDSGGPFVMENSVNGKWEVHGITSWGENCGEGTVFCRVAYYVNWIQFKLQTN